MRVAVYNMFFGFEGSTLLQQIRNHAPIHGWMAVFNGPKKHSENEIRKVRSLSRHVNETLMLVQETRADVLCLHEVLRSIYGDQLIAGLKERGYRSFHWGKSAHHEHPLDIYTLLATKYLSDSLEVSIHSSDYPGGGGGACGAYIKEKNISVLALHAAIKKPSVFKQYPDVQSLQWKQLRAIVESQKAKGRKCIVVGDMNATYNKLMKNTDFSSLGLHSMALPTYPSWPLVQKLVFKDFDHIFYSQKEFFSESKNTRKGRSDHLLLSCDLKPLC